MSFYDDWEMPPVRVYCKGCREWMNEDHTEFINIEEDFQGFDKLTFRCPQCGEISKSFRKG